MKHILMACLLMAGTLGVQGQLLKNLGNRAKQKVEQKAGEKMDKTIDHAVDGKTKTTEDARDDTQAASDKGVRQTAATTPEEGLKAYSKYDFVQGEKVIAFEDFASAAIGDFPTRWNTNGSGEVVTLNRKEGKWLKIDKEGYFHPEFINSLPDNSTLEFDLGVNDNFDWYNNTMQFFLTHLSDPAEFSKGFWHDKHFINIEVHPYRDANTFSGKMWLRSEKNGNATISNEVPVRRWDVKKNTFAHISLWRQGQRLRIYVNGEKVFDLPRAFDAASTYNALVFNSNGFHNEGKDYYLVGNIRLAAGAPDTRNKLITEGKFVTTGITFDVASDGLKPESFGVLREIANTLTENGGVKVRIVGHTDNAGEDAANLDLSKRRAAAVKQALVLQFGIEENRIQTEGLGETKPVADNGKPEGKAQNRRVEFIRL